MRRLGKPSIIILAILLGLSLTLYLTQHKPRRLSCENISVNGCDCVSCICEPPGGRCCRACSHLHRPGEK